MLSSLIPWLLLLVASSFVSRIASMSTRVSLRTFLKDIIRPSLTSPPFTSLVVGNEASDADSIISSLSYSYLSYIYPRDEVALRKQPFVPLVSVSREDMLLRSDVKILLHKADVDNNDLISVEDLSLESFAVDSRVDVALVDHNEISPKLQSKLYDIPWRVVQIVDHHADSLQYPYLAASQRLIAFDSVSSIALAGSTCTVIYEMFADQLIAETDRDICLLLLGVILLDTFNEDPQYGKNTARDDIAISALSAKLNYTRDDHIALFKELSNAKFDPLFWQSMTVKQCLRYDYKQFDTVIGMSSVLLPLPQFLTKAAAEDADIAETISSFMTNQRLEVLVVLSLVFDPNPIRQLLFISRQPQTVNAWHNQQTSTTITHKYPLDLMEMTLSEGDEGEGLLAAKFVGQGLYVKCYHQGNFNGSRKQIAPIVMEFMSSHRRQLVKL